jgi:hypothetical protein
MTSWRFCFVAWPFSHRQLNEGDKLAPLQQKATAADFLGLNCWAIRERNQWYRETFSAPSARQAHEPTERWPAARALENRSGAREQAFEYLL